ncbi:WecB/TagA/CpsF family glycosyltransferase, partial [Parvibaculum sp.]|uniref:WecB/TagA/CpsF family glycosyltransferase n=1 Tax=Parvibaculum sp. TaxID=2024848 RepID=UPI0034A066C1
RRPHAWRDHPLIAARRVMFLGSPMHLLTMEETLSLAVDAMTEHKPLHHTVVNVAKLVTMQTDDELRRDVAEADLINIDGMGVAWGARLFGISVPERVAGIDIMERLFALCAQSGFHPFLLGAEQHVLESVCRRLAAEFPSLEIAGCQDGYFAPEFEADIVKTINATGADCLFVAMPTPRKERFLHRHRDALDVSFVMGVGGSFDVYGGKVKRAPQWMQRSGLEWAFRIWQEPRRLWRRYYTTNSAYVRLLWAHRRQRAGR